MGSFFYFTLDDVYSVYIFFYTVQEEALCMCNLCIGENSNSNNSKRNICDNYNR